MDSPIKKSVDLSESSTKQIQTFSLEQLIEYDRENIRIQSQSISFYHPNIDREKSEELLKNQFQKTGTNAIFLLRDSKSSINNFGLSIIFDEKFYHYKVQLVHRNIFSIDLGPEIIGIENLIRYYQSRADGLISTLSKEFVRGDAPPMKIRAFGATNSLHRACQQGRLDIVKRIFSDEIEKVPFDINDKNSLGLTALHISARQGHDEIVRFLLKLGVDPSIRDAHGASALHHACAENRLETSLILLDEGSADVDERNLVNGWLPIHEAAFHDAAECFVLLLERAAPIGARTNHGKTARQLAEQNRAEKVLKILRDFALPNPKSNRADWFHETPNFDRFAAKNFIEKVPSNFRLGIFLIRPSSKNSKNFALTLSFENEFYNFEILTVDGPSFFIDDGPFFNSLEHLVDHYCRVADGLPTVLKFSIDVEGSVRTMENHCRKIIFKIQQNQTDFPTVENSKNFSTAKNDLNCSMATSSTFSSSLSNSAASLNSSVCSSISGISSTTSGLISPSSSNISLENFNEKSRKIDQNNFYRLNFISSSQIEKTEKLGEGEFGEVHKGFYFENSTVIPVAIKHLKDYSQTTKIDFLREAENMAKLNHHCICKLYGIVDSNSNEMMMIIEFLPFGSMLDYLWKYKSLISEYRLRLWSSQINDGMAYMERKGIVHRDLAARNILLQSTDRIKISDFGLSRCVDAAIYVQKSDSKIPVKWYAPEAITVGKFTSKSDVWSFGVTLWEMFSYGETPYGEMSGSDVYYTLKNGERLEKPINCPPSIYTIMQKCWQWDEDKRPTFSQLFQLLRLDSEKVQFRRKTSTDNHVLPVNSKFDDLSHERHFQL